MTLVPAGHAKQFYSNCEKWKHVLQNNANDNSYVPFVNTSLIAFSTNTRVDLDGSLWLYLDLITSIVSQV